MQAILNDQTHQTILKGLTTPDLALFIEQEVERCLGIKDQPVRGELPR